MIMVVGLIGYGMMNARLYTVLDTPHVADFQVSAASMILQALRDVSSLE